jgi:hypothetical protein
LPAKKKFVDSGFPEVLPDAIKEVTREQFSVLKSNSGVFPDFVLDLVAFGCDFRFVVEFARESGFYSLTEAQLVDLVKRNLVLVEERRSFFVEERLRLLVERCEDVIPELKVLYDEAVGIFRSLTAEGRHKEAVGYLSNLVAIQSAIGRLQDTVESVGRSVEASVVVHGDLNLRVFSSLSEAGVIVVRDEGALRERLGFSDSSSPADFIGRFRGVK